MEAKAASRTTKKACQRCRSLKARCPGPSPDTDRCARCIKGGQTECVYEQHKRGRKVGTRLSDPTKALMRMRSALSVLGASGELPPTALERVQAELREAQARAEASGSGSIKGKGKGKGKGKQAPQQTSNVQPIREQPDLEASPGDDDDGIFESDLDTSDGVGDSAGGRSSTSPRRPCANGERSAADFGGFDGGRNGSAGPPGLGRPAAPSFAGRADDGPPTAEGFANDDLYSYHLPSMSAAGLGGGSAAAGPSSYARPSSAASTSMRAQAHAQAALFGHSGSGSRSPQVASLGQQQQQQSSPAQSPFEGEFFAGQPRMPGLQSGRHSPAGIGRDFSGRLTTASSPVPIDPSLAFHHPALTSNGRYFAPGLSALASQPYPAAYPPTAIGANGGFSSVPRYTTAAQAAPHQFDELIPLRSSSKSLATLLRPRGFGPACDGGTDSLAAAEAAAAAEERAVRQDVVRMGLVGEQEARALFAFFMEKVGPLIYLFDPELHTHDAVRRCSPLLYATIIAIALRFNNAPEEKHRRVLAVARDNVLLVLADNIRSEETILALILQTEFKGIHDEGSYLMLGMAIRIGMDMDIGRPLPHLDERRNRSRMRCWIGLFNADRRFAGCGQVQKPEIMVEDATIRASVNFHDHPLRLASDTRLVAGTQLRRLLSRYSDLIQTAGNSEAQLNMRSVYEGASEEVDSWAVFWEGEIVRLGGCDRRGIELAKLHVKLQLSHHWIYRACRFPQSPWIKTPEEWETERRAALAACLGLSVGILNQMLMLPQDEILLYSPDSTHLFYAYGTFMCEKLFRARLLETHVLDPASTQLIFDVIRASADRLDSLTLSPGSVTALHATLLRSLLPESDPGSSARLSGGVAAGTGGLHAVSLPKGPQSPRPISPASHQQASTSQWTGPPLSAQQQQLSGGPTGGQHNDVVDFASFGASSGADGSAWEGLDQEALAALATLESSLGTFNWEELTYSPP